MSSKKKQKRRQERRFFPQSAMNPWLVRGCGAVGAATLGAGAWATYHDMFQADEQLRAVPSYLVAGGAVLTGLAIWLGTSSDPPIRVGAPGIAMDRGEVRRMPWYNIEKIHFEQGSLSLVVSGQDEHGQAWTLKVPVKAHPEAVGWIVDEAQRRVPKVVDITDSVLGKLPRAEPHAGLVIDLEPLQVVGKKCAATGKPISYEPDARVCDRCERVYFKRSVPKKCKCGASLADKRGAVGQDEPETTEDDNEAAPEDDEPREAREPDPTEA